jgi:hypothetical protein
MSRSSEPFACCHSEHSEESLSAQGRLHGEEILGLLLSLRMTESEELAANILKVKVGDKPRPYGKQP